MAQAVEGGSAMTERKPGQLWWINAENGDEFYTIISKAPDRGDNVMWNIFRHDAKNSFNMLMQWSEDSMRDDELISE